MKVKLKVYDGVKYWDGTQKVAEVNYDIQGYEVKQIPDEEIAAMGFDTVDEFNEEILLQRPREAVRRGQPESERLF